MFGKEENSAQQLPLRAASVFLTLPLLFVKRMCTSLNPVWAQRSGFISWLQWGWGHDQHLCQVPFRTPPARVPAWTPACQPIACCFGRQCQREEGGVERQSSEEKWYCVRILMWALASIEKRECGKDQVAWFTMVITFTYYFTRCPVPQCICKNKLLWNFDRKIRLKKS